MKSNYFSSTLNFCQKFQKIKGESIRLFLIPFFLMLLITVALGQERVYPIANFPHPSESSSTVRSLARSTATSGLTYEHFKSLYYDINPTLFINSNGSISDATEGKNAKVINVGDGAINSLRNINKNTTDVELLVVDYPVSISFELLKSFPKLKLIVIHSKVASKVLNSENVYDLFDSTIWNDKPELQVVYKNTDKQG